MRLEHCECVRADETAEVADGVDECDREGAQLSGLELMVDLP